MRCSHIFSFNLNHPTEWILGFPHVYLFCYGNFFFIFLSYIPTNWELEIIIKKKTKWNIIISSISNVCLHRSWKYQPQIAGVFFLFSNGCIYSLWLFRSHTENKKKFFFINYMQGIKHSIYQLDTVCFMARILYIKYNVNGSVSVHRLFWIATTTSAMLRINT